MSNPNIEMTEADSFGQKHPLETQEMIQNGLSELVNELEKIPGEEREGWDEAVSKCDPKLIGDDFRLKFLRAEVFNADLAAKRICGYWTKRINVFGPEKAFLPLTLGEALKDDDVALKRGVANVVPVKHPSGRSVFFFDPSHVDRSKYTRESMLRAIWYFLHVAIEDESAQQKGVIMMVYPEKANFGQFDSGVANGIMSSLKLCMPMRASAFVICQPPHFFSLIYSVVSVFMGERLKKRVKVFSGTQEEVMESLAEMDFTKEILPVQLGGEVELDMAAFVEDRKVAGK